ncbi:hypothetical protein EVAR_74874_1 [Eumeta japonica]|uniref:Reverse transcriptase domain-containing protein n=1 Tax=Eumeta variegata TaxID=151549 RepID=A0A4C1SSD6_EUMVA|nr:hypothetical protein EVAR_74874_1 [Eumeta japonica]
MCVEGGVDDKIVDVCKLLKDRRLDILCMNEDKRKGSGGASKRGSFDTYWSGVDHNQRGCRGVDFILLERLSECVNGYECVSGRDGCLFDLKGFECRIRMDELSVKWLLYADEQVILVPSACALQDMVNKMNDYVTKMGTKVNVGKIKVIVFEKGESTTECDLLIEGEKVEHVKDGDAIAAQYVWSVWKDRCRNSDVRERCGLKEDVVTRVEREMLLWFGHLER